MTETLAQKAQRARAALVELGGSATHTPPPPEEGQPDEIGLVLDGPKDLDALAWTLMIDRAKGIRLADSGRVHDLEVGAVRMALFDAMEAMGYQGDKNSNGIDIATEERFDPIFSRANCPSNGFARYAVERYYLLKRDAGPSHGF